MTTPCSFCAFPAVAMVELPVSWDAWTVTCAYHRDIAVILFQSVDDGRILDTFGNLIGRVPVNVFPLVGVDA